MFDTLKIKAGAILYKYFFGIYRPMYFNFKNKKDKYNLKVIAKLISHGNTVLDIGSNVGFYSSYFSKLVGDTGHVYCFEPDVTNFKHLQKEMSGVKNVTLIQKAVASESGNLTLYKSKLLNVDHRTYEPKDYSEKYSVEKISVDDFVGNKIKVDFIKMDIQGFEMEAIKGMNKTLQLNPELVIFTEFWPYGLQSAGSSAEEMFDYISNLGYYIYKIGKGNIGQLSRNEITEMKVEYFTDADVIITRKKLQK